MLATTVWGGCNKPMIPAARLLLFLHFFSPFCKRLTGKLQLQVMFIHGVSWLWVNTPITPEEGLGRYIQFILIDLLLRACEMKWMGFSGIFRRQWKTFFGDLPGHYRSHARRFCWQKGLGLRKYCVLAERLPGFFGKITECVYHILWDAFEPHFIEGASLGFLGGVFGVTLPLLAPAAFAACSLVIEWFFVAVAWPAFFSFKRLIAMKIWSGEPSASTSSRKNLEHEIFPLVREVWMNSLLLANGGRKFERFEGIFQWLVWRKWVHTLCQRVGAVPEGTKFYRGHHLLDYTCRLWHWDAYVGVMRCRPLPMPGLSVLEWELELGSLTSHIIFDTGSCCRVNTCKSLKKTFKNHEFGVRLILSRHVCSNHCSRFPIWSGDVQRMLLEVKEIPTSRKTKIKGQLSPITRIWKFQVQNTPRPKIPAFVFFFVVRMLKNVQEQNVLPKF